MCRMKFRIPGDLSGIRISSNEGFREEHFDLSPENFRLIIKNPDRQKWQPRSQLSYKRGIKAVSDGEARPSTDGELQEHARDYDDWTEACRDEVKKSCKSRYTSIRRRAGVILRCDLSGPKTRS